MCLGLALPPKSGVPIQVRPDSGEITCNLACYFSSFFFVNRSKMRKEPTSLGPRRDERDHFARVWNSHQAIQIINVLVAFLVFLYSPTGSVSSSATALQQQQLEGQPSILAWSYALLVVLALSSTRATAPGWAPAAALASAST